MQSAINNPEGAFTGDPFIDQTVVRFVAGGTVVANRAVTIDGDGVKPATAVSPVLGVSQTGGDAGEVIDVVISGEGLVEAGDTCTAGTNLIFKATGGTVETGTAASSLNVGIALETASSGLVRVWVAPS